jgi:hypothetical protein
MWARVLLNGQCLFIGTLLFILLQGRSLALDLALELGHGEEDTDRGGLALQWEWDKKWLATGNWYLGGYWEASFSYWDGEAGRSGTGSLAELGFTPVFRVQPRDPLYGLWPYVEAAVGIHLMTEEELGERTSPSRLPLLAMRVRGYALVQRGVWISVTVISISPMRALGILTPGSIFT